MYFFVRRLVEWDKFEKVGGVGGGGGKVTLENLPPSVPDGSHNFCF